MEERVFFSKGKTSLEDLHSFHSQDKEKHLSELEELLTQPEINRDSIYAWKLRYSDLVEELFPQEDGDAQEKSESAAEGGEGETQDQEHSETGKEDEKLESSEAERSEKEVKEETPEEVEKKSDEELVTSSKEKDEENVVDKQAVDKGKEKTEDDQEIVKEEEPSSEKQEETEEIETDDLTVIVQIEQSPAESVPVADSEQNVQETGTEKKGEISAEPSGKQKPSDSQEGSGEQKDSEETLDTHL